METQNENVYVNPDVDSHILSATAKEVILRGCTFEKDSPEAEPQPYVLKITRETYCGAHSLVDAARILLGEDVSKEIRTEMKDVQFHDLSPQRQ